MAKPELPGITPDQAKAISPRVGWRVLSAEELQQGTERVPSARVTAVPESIDFWREVHSDLSSMTGFIRPMSVRSFLNYYHPQLNSDGWYMKKGVSKYKPIVEAFQQRETAEGTEQDLEGYIIEAFTPPAENQELTKLVDETRQLMASRLNEPRLKMNQSLGQLHNPQFWDGFQQDLGTLDIDTSFSNFLLYHDPNDPEAIRKQWLITGKYGQHYYAVRDHLYYERARLVAEGVDRANTPSTSSKSVGKVFFDAAPPEVKIQLCTRFPKEFGEEALSSLEDSELLPERLKFVLNKVNLLSPDNQDQILDAVAGYISSGQERAGKTPLPHDELKRVLEQGIHHLEPSQQQIGHLSIDDLLSGTEHVLSIIEESKSEDEGVATPAKALLESLEHSYYLPLFKSVLYKPAALFWTMYQQKGSPEGLIPSAAMGDFLENYMRGKSEEAVKSEEERVVLEHLQGAVEPQVYKYFAEIAAFGAQIQYFAKEDRAGNPQYLFLHQIEGIRLLLEKGGGILADEPGTGKTMILSLAALNLLERRRIPDQRTGRILVVGSKSVVDNWEGELNKHLEPDQFDVVNVSFTQEKREADTTFNIRQRLRMLESVLASPAHDKQFVLVNYDIFRNPTFRRLLEKYNFDVRIVDEAHNVKSRFFQSLGSEEPKEGKKSPVAQRTSSLYAFLKSNPEAAVFLATSTPFVKELVEPLIMAHLANPGILPEDMIAQLSTDVVGTNKALRDIMIRRRKEEIADLPTKETKFIPIDLGSMSPQDRAVFSQIAQQITSDTKGAFATFYALLALEGQAKFPWLVDKVNEIIDDDRKVIVFTPFVQGEKRLTSSISTAAIAERLQQMGIDSVGVLDGSLTENQRLAVQQDFLRKDGIKVLVGNYATAGEAITLNSAENRATEVILFIAPNAISRFIQSVDRIHRIGQAEQVTIHLPFLTGDILGRLGGTYDERVTRRLIDEMKTFEAVVDGLFFVEQKDIYQTIIQGERSKIHLPVTFEVNRSGKAAREINKPVNPTPEDVFTGRYQFNPLSSTVLSKAEAEDSFSSHGDGAVLNVDQIFYKNQGMIYDPNETSPEDIYFAEINNHPILTRAQEGILFDYLRNERPIEDLAQDELFIGAGFPKEAEKMQAVLSRSSSVKEVIVNCNQRLVISIARKKYGAPLLDRIQDGNLGLLRAITDFDSEKETKFSTYATYWITQHIDRAMKTTDRPIRLPVHIEEGIRKARNLANAFQSEEGRMPSAAEIKELLVSKGGYGDLAAEGILNTFRTGVINVGSLNIMIGHDADDSELVEFIADRRDVDARDQIVDITSNLAVEQTEENELRALIEVALAGFGDRTADIMRMRYGFDGGEERTLQEVGDEFSITRERVRQIEAKTLTALANNVGLRELWSAGLPSYAYHLSAEETALRMGLLDTSQDKLEKAAARADRREAQKGISRGEIIFNRAETGGQTDTDPVAHLVEKARQNPDVWNQLAERERSILPLYFRKGSDREALKDRLATIFGMLTPDLESLVNQAVDHITELTKPEIPLRGTTSSPNGEVVYRVGAPQGGLVERRPSLKERILEMALNGSRNGQIASELHSSVHHVARTKTQLIKEGKLQPGEKRTKVVAEA